MRGAEPATEPAGAQIDASSEGAVGTALDAEMQECAIQFLHPTTPGDAGLLQTGLAVSRRDRAFEPGRWRLGIRLVGRHGFGRQ
jgi:hypothetical protein